jgi:thiol:disulfide interchange protein/DsbC/DsbD-like thiol-disulfide interchange protein
MRLRIVLQILLATLLLVAPAHAAHTKAQLLLSAETAKPGNTIWAGVDLKMEPGWHTYWKNPGEAGQATEIKWQLPPGVTAGEIQWPLPKKIPPDDVTTFGYEDEVVLLAPLTLASNLPAGLLTIAAKVSWLECKELCIPASANVSAVINTGTPSGGGDGANEKLLASWRAKVPAPAEESFSVSWAAEPPAGDKRPLTIKSSATWMLTPPPKTPKISKLDFYPDANDQFELGDITAEFISDSKDEFQLQGTVKKFSGAWPRAISGVLVAEIGGEPRGYSVQLPISEPSPQIEVTSQPLWQMLLFAFIGGLILNIMPCVLPVIALKILGFVNEAKSETRRVRKLGVIYALGVLLSFLVLAGIVIGVKAAGHHAGWGMQFGSPVFIVCLTTLVTLVALNLFGVFEVALGGRALDTAGKLAARHGAIGAFFNGVLATILATPCTAPFLGAALGFAFAQSASIIALIFLTVGLGLASPYLLLSWNPAWLKFLPKPGAWMERFKIAMGFPMLATVVWLFNIAASSYGKNVLWLGIFLVVVAFAAWVFGEFFQRARQHNTMAAIIALLLFISGYAFALENELDWRHVVPQTDSAASLKESADGIEWQRWSPEAVAQAHAAGKIVLVDFTADWCLTCQVNKKTSIENLAVREKLKSLNVVTLLGDYTHFPDDITTELNRHNRAGVPLVLVYPKNPAAQPIVLPEVLTPGIVLDSLERAAK